ncbi:ABC transporter substrate-binding protein [Cellulomonas dongxiuzhuiae]|uniref:Extracellular solute-binding protein n=1 Tax=Cellulomonas dongxiuzhuiae TaxID=2819979 RepID=A0ABX8GMF5_9CELL|nr:extracellular solute-binding protein [Cellulomonas dongxiuzhuiae]MBO3090241.1 extracellular solute-binding protein [Cellulomonas dongxiuzhuiae]MBO3095759.1 extracellular solute-binding protein [Cellulomonas dongxiuzhuiae]QWC17072.1 extracellular solute-binding protein [Cellulomonas dongxiuzhuiae]
MKRTAALRAVALGAAVAMIATACSSGSGSDDATEGPGENVTLSWWHNSNTGAGKDYYDQLADEFESDHPGVTIEVTALQHEDMLIKLDAAFQSGDAPDVYMERGGGELKAHVAAELTKDITDDAADTIAAIEGSVAGWTVEDRVYSLPFSMGVVGFWYNKTMFAEAGITEPPKTMTDFYAAVDALKAVGIEPVSVGAGSAWPAAHYWYYFALRQCSQDTIAEASQTLEFTDDCWVRAGESLEELVSKAPFNTGFLGTEAQGTPESASGLLANRKVAMELAGHWEPGVMQGLTEDEQGLGEDTAWFPFPEVEGGEGDPAAQLGGGDAWACSQDAPDVCVDFIEFMLSNDVQKGFAELDMGLPTLPAATAFVAAPELAQLLSFRNDAPYVQLYFDTQFGESIGGAMNEAIVSVFAGSGTPQGVVDATQAAADLEK